MILLLLKNFVDVDAIWLPLVAAKFADFVDGKV
jgi:hypothetical protein